MSFFGDEAGAMRIARLVGQAEDNGRTNRRSPPLVRRNEFALARPFGQAQNGALSQDDHIRAIVKFTNYKKFNFHSKIKITYGNETIAPGAKQPDGSAQQQPTAQKPQ